jgi:hypothetical protein
MIFLLAVKSYDMGPTALLPFRGSCAADFIALKDFISSAGFEPANLGSNGKHAITEVTFLNLLMYLPFDPRQGLAIKYVISWRSTGPVLGER